jgi:hypothetical protein
MQLLNFTSSVTGLVLKQFLRLLQSYQCDLTIKHHIEV